MEGHAGDPGQEVALRRARHDDRGTAAIAQACSCSEGKHMS